MDGEMKLTEEQIEELLDHATDMLIENKSWRWGQSLFNALHKSHPKIADSIRGTEYDPFYLSDRSQSMLDYLTETKK